MERKIAMVVRRISHAEAERDDDKYWMNTSHSERLNTLYELRHLIGAGGKMERVVVKTNKRNGQD